MENACYIDLAIPGDLCFEVLGSSFPVGIYPEEPEAPRPKLAPKRHCRRCDKVVSNYRNPGDWCFYCQEVVIRAKQGDKKAKEIKKKWDEESDRLRRIAEAEAADRRRRLAAAVCSNDKALTGLTRVINVQDKTYDDIVAEILSEIKAQTNT
jgi:hypothetical protein